MNKKYIIIAASVVAICAITGVVTLPAFADTVLDAQVNAHVKAIASTSVNTNIHAEHGRNSTTTDEDDKGNGGHKMASSTVRVSTKADAEIDRRINSITTLIARINDNKKLSADSKTALTTSLNAQITLLQDLKTKIDAGADLSTLKADTKSITKDYRVYMLVVPQAQVLAAADRANTIADMFDTIEAKISLRLANGTSTNATSTSETKADLSAVLDQMKAKVADARVQITAAINAVVNLKPDQGDATVAASNHQALVSARASLRNAYQDFAAARASFAAARKDLK